MSKLINQREVKHVKKIKELRKFEIIASAGSRTRVYCLAIILTVGLQTLDDYIPISVLENYISSISKTL